MLLKPAICRLANMKRSRQYQITGSPELLSFYLTEPRKQYFTSINAFLRWWGGFNHFRSKTKPPCNENYSPSTLDYVFIREEGFVRDCRRPAASVCVRVRATSPRGGGLVWWGGGSDSRGAALSRVAALVSCSCHCHASCVCECPCCSVLDCVIYLRDKERLSVRLHTHVSSVKCTNVLQP